MSTPQPSEQITKDQRYRDEIKKKTGKTPEELYELKEKRIRDAIQLQEPDKIPVIVKANYFAARYTGIPMSTVFYDAVAWKDAVKRTMLDLQPDAYRLSESFSGRVLEALNPQHMRWPGGTLSPDVSYQYIDGEYMKADEYDLFLSDASDFMLRMYLPRLFGALEPLAKLPRLTNLIGTSFVGIVQLFATPEFRQLAESLQQAGEEQVNWQAIMGSLEEEMAAIGMPPLWHSSQAAGFAGGAPFDTFADYLRGMHGTMVDMYRQPAKLLAACDKVWQLRLARAKPADPQKRGNPKRVPIVVHWGAEGFMSKKQFESFYWPGWKKVILASIDYGYVPILVLEGKFGDRLEYLLELPQKQFIVFLHETDMALGKSVLGNHCCIMGNVPASLLEVGSVSEVEDYCRNLIEVCGKGGGFILTNRGSLDEAKPANVKAMVDSVIKYHPN